MVTGDSSNLKMLSFLCASWCQNETFTEDEKARNCSCWLVAIFYLCPFFLFNFGILLLIKVILWMFVFPNLKSNRNKFWFCYKNCTTQAPPQTQVYWTIIHQKRGALSILFFTDQLCFSSGCWKRHNHIPGSMTYTKS